MRRFQLEVSFSQVREMGPPTGTDPSTTEKIISNKGGLREDALDLISRVSRGDERALFRRCNAQLHPLGGSTSALHKNELTNGCKERRLNHINVPL